MRLQFFLLFIITFKGCINKITASNCGCKVIRPCFKEMLDAIKDHDEATCIEDASIGASTLTVFLQAIRQFCGNITDIYNDKITFEGRHLFEVIIKTPIQETEDNRPVILIDAGQEAGTEPVILALYVIQQLVMCEENNDMIKNVRWVILPCTNPDGQEYARFQQKQWRKNLRPSEDGISYGVDISRNFEGDWKSCPRITTGFSPIFPGLSAASENETIFIQRALTKYKKDIKAYLSIRRDGHSISFPYGYDSSSPPATNIHEKTAGAIALRVNQRAGSVQVFTNQSIFDLNGKERCGHSVDYAHKHVNVLHSYEMRVFMESDNKIMSKFQTFPRGYVPALRNGYYRGIKELYNVVIKEH